MGRRETAERRRGNMAKALTQSLKLLKSWKSYPHPFLMGMAALILLQLIRKFFDLN